MLGARNPSVRLVRHKSELCGNKRPKSEVICPGVGIPNINLILEFRFFGRYKILVFAGVLIYMQG